MAAGPQYVVLDPSVAEGTGKLVALQRHGEAEKNVVLKADKTRLKAEVAAELAAGATRESPSVEKRMADWDALSKSERWFDDSLDAAGVQQAMAAGRELAAWLRGAGVAAPAACCVSPFRRALQTQEFGYRAAGFEATGGLLGDGTPWIARHELRETPYDEASCRRHDTRLLAKWLPLLDTSGIDAVNTASEPVTQLTGPIFGDGGNCRGILEANAEAFVAWLRGRREAFLWVTTHQGPAREILAHVFGPGDRGYDHDLKNATCVVFRLPA